NDNDEVSIPKSLLAREFKTKDLGPLWYFLGIEAGRSRPSVILLWQDQWRTQAENGSEEVKKRINMSFVKMSASFPDPTKAEDCFQKLHVMKDNVIFNSLVELLEEVKFESARTKRDNLLRKIGDKHSIFGFLRLLSSKCSYNIFSSELVHSVRFGNKHLEDSSLKLLLNIISMFPPLLRGSEEQLRVLLLDEDIPLDEELIRILEKQGARMSIKLSDIYPSLERVCLEGTRAQSKLAVSAIAALIDTSEKSILLELCKKLVDALHSGQNIPTVLQSLGCLARHSISTFEAHDSQISRHIFEEVFHATDEEMSSDIGSSDENSECSFSCKIKRRIQEESFRKFRFESGNPIFGLKALVKSFLPHQNIQNYCPYSNVMGWIFRIFCDVFLPFFFFFHCLKEVPRDQLSEEQRIKISIEINGKTAATNETDKAHIRLAAAKSVLRLSKRWDLHMSPLIFRLTVLMAKDPSSLVRRSFVRKIYKLLKERALPKRYACAFALAASDALKDLQEDAYKYMAEFVKEYTQEAQIKQTLGANGGVTDYPMYIVVYLIHVLAHDSGFPHEDSEDEDIYAQFCSPLLLMLQAFLNAGFVDDGKDLAKSAGSSLRSIFIAIKRAEDAVDAQLTPVSVMVSQRGQFFSSLFVCLIETKGFIMLQKLHILADFGISILDVFSSGMCMSHAPNLILLPSSLYRNSLIKKTEANCSKDKEA
ncbi:hypothetical protein RJ639_001569, partial [Escallonia herrerae]